MAIFKPSYAASADSLTVTNLQSLADNAFWESASRNNNSDLALALHLFITLVTTTTAGDAQGFVNAYLSGSVDGGTAFAGTSPDGTESTATFNANTEQSMILLDVIPVDASETTARTFKFLVEVDLKFPPKNYVLVLENQTGAALASSANAVEVMEIQTTDA